MQEKSTKTEAKNRLLKSCSVIVLLALALLAVASCSTSSQDAPTTEDASPTQAATDNTSPPAANSSAAPDPAFDPLLPALKQMSTAPIRLPASLPPENKSVAIEQDPNENPYTTGGDKYTILFLYDDSGSSQITQPYVHYKTLGRLSASPASAPLPDLTGGLGITYQLGNITLPDGTVADLKRVEPPLGANYGPFTEGTFEEEGERYTVEIENDSPEGDSAHQILSTMVKVPRAPDT